MSTSEMERGGVEPAAAPVREEKRESPGWRRCRVGWWLVAAWLVGSSWDAGRAETMVMPWGTVAGQRVGEEWVGFEGGLRWVHPGWEGFSTSVKYLQRPTYSRTNQEVTVVSAIEGVEFRQVVTERGPGAVRLQLNIVARTNAPLEGGYYCLDLPPAPGSPATVEFLPVPGESGRDRLVLSPAAGGGGEWGRRRARGVRFADARRTLELRWPEAREVIVRREASSAPLGLNDPAVRQRLLRPEAGEKVGTQIYVEVFGGEVWAGRVAALTLEWEWRTVRDRGPVRLTTDVTRPGARFDGMGGNFRWQFPATDAAVIAYNLEALPIAWGRLDIPWAEWHPDEAVDPLVAARAGSIHPRVRVALDTVRTLAARNLSLILSAWSPPRWAMAPVQVPGRRGVALDPAKLEAVCVSLAKYLAYVREIAGREPALISFNEPETGVEVRQTAAEHAEFVARMGVELERRGLSTRCLLGDTAHETASALAFLGPSLADTEARRAVGAVGFHTWRGCQPGTLREWRAAAGGMGVPLLVTEAGPDAHLHEYPAVRLENWFQLQSIELYVRCMAHAQPATLMEWQLTSDYSVLAGGGVYGESGPLRPTQRFWHLKQLGKTPRGAKWLPVESDRADLTCAAFGDFEKGVYGVHVVNPGSARRLIWSGIPSGESTWRQWVTDPNRGMEEVAHGRVRRGTVTGWLPSGSFTTILVGR